MPKALSQEQAELLGWYHLEPAVTAPKFSLINAATHELIELEDITAVADKCLLTFLPGVWAPWCRKFLQQLQEYQEVVESTGTCVVAVVSQDKKRLGSYVEEAGIDFPVLADPYGGISTRYGIFDDIVAEPMKLSRPVLFVLDSDGRIHYKYLGRHLRDRPQLMDVVQLLQQDLRRKRFSINPFGLFRKFYAGG